MERSSELLKVNYKKDVLIYMSKIIKRIIKPDKYLSLIKYGDEFYVAFEANEEDIDLLKKIGFNSLTSGETVLPAIFGRISRFNAEGEEEICKDLPKETVYYPKEWTVKDWGGHEHTGVSYVPYKRYPRDFISPPSLELKIIEKNGKKFIISKKFKNIKENYKDIKHVMNLFLEIFKDMLIIKDDMTIPYNANLVRVNWKMLPPGVSPWEKFNEQVKKITERVSTGKKRMFKERFDHLESYHPEEIAIGLGGFTGYLMFGFKSKNIYLLESLKYGNATYVLDANWEIISKMSKAEILQNNYQKQRIVHRDIWSDEIDNLFKI